MWNYVAKYLLLQNDRLELAGLGKFSATNIKAVIDETNKKISPTKRVFFFEQGADKTTDDFINYIAQNLHLSNEQAQKYINEEIQNALQKLNNGLKIYLPLIGYLQKIDDKITLLQNTKYSLHPENFGFTEIEIPPKITETKKETKLKKEKVEQQPVKIETKLPVITWLKRAAIVIIIISIAGIIAYYSDQITNLFKLNKHTTNTKTTTVDATTTEKKTQPPQIQDTTILITQTQPKIDTQPKTSEQPISQPSQTEQQILEQFDITAHIYIGPKYKKYYVIVGSFRKFENAQKFKQQLLQKGFSYVEVLSTAPDTNRVALIGSNDLNQIYQEYQKYKQIYPDAGAWLLINQKQ